VSGGKRGAGAAGGASKKACCMVSEILEEAGIDRERARQIRRQLLEGVVLMCQWQLQRMHGDEPNEPAAPRARRGRKIQVE
jgi:hypothetical protein